MHFSSFNVSAQVFVEINPSNPPNAKKILVPNSLLRRSHPLHETIVLERENDTLAVINTSHVQTKIVNMAEYQILEGDPGEKVLAHAVALYHAGDWPESIEYSEGDRFFLMPTPDNDMLPKCGATINVFNLDIGKAGLVPVRHLRFYPHMKVIEEFEFKVGNVEIQNKIGEHFTIERASWVMHYTPEGPTNRKQRVTFGRNIDTGYSGFVRMHKVAELEPGELEDWKKRLLLPEDSSTKSANWPSVHASPPCNQDCQCESGAGNKGQVERLRHEHGVFTSNLRDSIPSWRQRYPTC